MRPNQSHVPTRERKADECGCRLRRKPLALEPRYDAIGNLDHARGVRRTLESRTTDHGPSRAIDDEEPVMPRIRPAGLPERGKPIGRYVVGYIELSEALSPGHAHQVFKQLRLVDQGEQMFSSARQQREAGCFERHARNRAAAQVGDQRSTDEAELATFGHSPAPRARTSRICRTSK